MTLEVTEALRAFIALELPREAKARLAVALEPLRSKLAGARWIKLDALHLTLRFLGDSRPGQIDAIEAALERATHACSCAEGRLREMGAFPERGAPRVLWVGLDLPARVLELQQACESAARAAGYAPERRAFVPHLTVARWRAPVPRPRLEPFDLGPVALATVVLYRSHLDPRGAVYTPLATFALA